MQLPLSSALYRDIPTQGTVLESRWCTVCSEAISRNVEERGSAEALQSFLFTIQENRAARFRNSDVSCSSIMFDIMVAVFSFVISLKFSIGVQSINGAIAITFRDAKIPSNAAFSGY
eukprot:IDg10448t1